MFLFTQASQHRFRVHSAPFRTLRTSIRAGGLTAILSASIAGLVHGEQPSNAAPSSTTSSTVTLPTVVVTDTPLRTNEDILNIPASVDVLDNSTINERQPRTPNVALKEEPGIWSVNVAAQGSPILRGQIGNRVLYLWDGIRINNGSSFAGPNGYFNQFPLGAIDRMEVVRGSGSVQYGSDAVGGVINIFSKKAAFSDHFEIGGDLYGRYGSNDDENTEEADLHISSERFALAAGFTRQEVDNYDGRGSGTISPTGFNALGGYANIAIQPFTDQTLRFSWIGNQRTDVDSYVQSKLNANGVPRIFNPLEHRDILKLDYTALNLSPWSDELKFYGYYQRYHELRERRTDSGTSFTNITTDTKQSIWGLGLQNTTSIDKFRFIYGVDYRTEDLGSSLHQRLEDELTGETSTSIPNGKTPAGTYNVFDAFLTGEYRPTSFLLFNAGVRFENTQLHSTPVAADVIPNAGYTLQQLRVQKDWQSFTWNIGSVLNVTKHFDLVANISSAFRAPTYSDLLSAGTPVFSSRIASVPALNLDPEKAITYEFGPRYHDEKFSGFVTGYYTHLYDVVSQVESGTVNIPGQGTFAATHNANSGRGYVTGVETSISYRPIHDWTVFANATYTYGQDSQNDVALRFIPPFFGTFGIRYDSPSGRWWVEATEEWALRLTRHAPQDEQDAGFSLDPAFGSPNTTNNKPLRDNFDIPGYWITNVRGGWKVWQHGTREFTVTLDLNNIFNRRYREAYAQQEVTAPGFGATIGARLTF